MAVNGEPAGGVVVRTDGQTTITIEDGEHLINPTTGVIHRFNAADRRFHYVGQFDPQTVLHDALERAGLDA